MMGKLGLDLSSVSSVSALCDLGQVISFLLSLGFPVWKMGKSGIENDIVLKVLPALRTMLNL